MKSMKQTEQSLTNGSLTLILFSGLFKIFDMFPIKNQQGVSDVEWGIVEKNTYDVMCDAKRRLK